MDWFYIVEGKNRGLVALPENRSQSHWPFVWLVRKSDPVCLIQFGFAGRTRGSLQKFHLSATPKWFKPNANKCQVRCLLCFSRIARDKNNTAPSLSSQMGVKHFWARPATIDRKEKKKHLRTNVSSEERRAFISDRVTCPFFGSFFFFRGTKRDKVKGGQEVHVTCFIFFSNIDLKIAASFPSRMFLGRDVQDGSCRLWALFNDSPRAVVLNATKIPRRPFKGWIQAEAK